MADRERSFFSRCFSFLTGPIPVFVIVTFVTAGLSELPTPKEILQVLRDFPIGTPALALHLILPIAVGVIAATGVFLGRVFYGPPGRDPGEDPAGTGLTKGDRARAILRCLPGMVISLSRNGEITYRNPAAKAQYASGAGKGIDPLDDIIEQSGLRSMLDTVFEGECITMDEVPVPRGEDSEIQTLRIKGLPVTKGGKITEALFLLEDVTEDNILKKQLIESEEVYRNIFRNAPMGIFLVDREGMYLDANPAALNILGYTLNELRTLNTRELSSDSETRIANLPSSLGPIVERTRYLRKDGRVVEAELTACSFQRGEDILFIGIIREIATPEKNN